MKKICVYCQKEFEVISRQGGMNRKVCYECIPDGLEKGDRQKRERAIIRQKINQQKVKRGCDICGYNKCPTALEWHHENDNKNFNPGDIIKGTAVSFEKYQQEVDKCILVCANCHREIHWQLDKESLINST